VVKKKPALGAATTAYLSKIDTTSTTELNASPTTPQKASTSTADKKSADPSKAEPIKESSTASSSSDNVSLSPNEAEPVLPVLVKKPQRTIRVNFFENMRTFIVDDGDYVTRQKRV